MWWSDHPPPRGDESSCYFYDAPPTRHLPYDTYSSSGYRSRYTARYDNDRRSRSPRDRSPDRYNDRASQYSDGDRRRTSGDSRGNASAFQANRDSFRDSLTGREPPRGPKALIDPPSGPRGGYGGDFRGGRGRGRGRGWRDDSRDRGRDRDDFRDRRDGPPFRDDRSRERDRDWRDRDNFRGRRPSPQGRGRSPPGRDFRDRDGPLGVDADRARRESRDGPLSAGSSSSDPPFASQSYRGGSYRGRGRGRGGDWGRGDMDRGRGRSFYDERDRFRSRSQEGRWGRDRDDRDNHRYIDSDVRSRDSREDRDPRDPRDRDARPKLDRQSSIAHDPPPPTKDVSPPPLAPSAPAFGSVPSRQPSTTEIPKAPPTGPRALTEDRPVSAGQQASDQRLPPSGPSKSLADVSPPIPTGPRAQHQKQQRPSSKQWINPALQGKSLKVPESPSKINRSQSFVASQQSRPFGSRPDSSNSDNHGDLDRRPRSSGANADSQIAVADGQLRSLRISEPDEITFSSERGTQSARASVDRETRAPFLSSDAKSGDREPSERGSIVSAISPRMPKAESPVLAKATQSHNGDGTKAEDSKEHEGQTVSRKRTTLNIPTVRFALPPKVSTLPSVDHSSESDDEDIDDYFEMEIGKAEAELKKLESAGESVPTDFVVRFANLSHEALVAQATAPDGPKALLGPLPEGIKIPRETQRAASLEKPSDVDADAATKVPPAGDSAKQTTADQGEAAVDPEEPKPKVEEMDIDTSHVPIPTVEHPEQKDDTADVEMDDAGQLANGLPASESDSAVLNGTPGEAAHHLLPPGFEQPPTGLSTPTQMEMEDDDDDETEIEEIDYATIETVRQYMKTPPVDSLPQFSCRPWFRDRQFIKSMDPSPDVHAFVASLMRDSAIVTMAAQEEARHEYAEDYEMYLRFTLSDDPIAVKSRDKFSTGNPNGEIPPSHPAGHESRPEGRRTGRFATERDLERALQESLQAENERREREERAQREKYRSAKEAEIPDMYWTIEERDKDLFLDHSGFLPPERLVATWQVLPPVANFTEEEAEQFEKAYLEFPKQWGKIAENIPTRDFHSCIQYYYIKKKDLNLKEKLKKQPRRRKKGGRGKQRSSALVTEVLGIGDENTEENHETGENGERRRPRRAAAPTFGPNNHEATPAADSDGTATPGRRHAAGKNDSGAEKTDRRRRRGREKEPKQAKPAQALAPTPPVSAKANRSRSNSRAQGPEFLSPQTPADMGRVPMQLDGSPSAGMQPPLVPNQPLLSPERAVPTAAGSSISEVMAPPSLRPEPPPPPPSVATFEISQPAAPDRLRTPQQASSYWSVSESNEFPALLRSFGTDWGSIAAHMQTKTHVMVKNYYVRQKDAGKVEWEAIAHDADQKRARGEKLPPPPTMTQGPRNKRYDTPATLHRPLAAAEAPEDVPTKLESHASQAAQPFSRFQVPVPIAQAPPAATAQPGAQPLQAQQAQPATQAMSPTARPLRAPLPTHGYAEREAESAVLPQSQPGRASQKPLSAAPAAEQLQPGVQPRGQGWLADYGTQLNLLNTHKSRRADLQPKEEPRAVERPLKQEPDQGTRYEPFVPREAPQPIARAAAARNEPISIARSAEPPRTIVSGSQAYPPSSQQAVRNMVGEQGPPVTLAPPVERPSSGLQRPLSTSMQDPYGAPPPQQPSSTLAPPAARPPERKTSSLMALLNDDPTPAPPPPKRVSEVAGSGLKPSSSPPPQGMSSRAPPPSTAGQLRREETPVYSYPRNPPVQSAIPSLKPYNPTQTQSPQPQHMTVQRSTMVSPVEAASAAERDYYSRHPYGPPQHQPPSSNSPQSHHYPPPSQHSQMGYQSQGTAYPPYSASVSQPHAASPTPQYAGHPGAGGRRDPVQQSRETAWPPTQRQEPSPASMQQQQTAWPPPKSSQPPPTQSAWGAQHGAPPKPAPNNNSMQQQPSWASAPPPQQSFRDSLRDDRGPYPPVHDSRSPSDPRMIGHQHQHSLSGRYPPASNPRDVPPQAPQPAYPRYATPGPGQGRDMRDPGPPRSYTPVSAYDSRGPPPGAYAQEMQMRDPRVDPRDPRDPVTQLQRQLRPHEEYNRPPERRY